MSTDSPGVHARALRLLALTMVGAVLVIIGCGPSEEATEDDWETMPTVSPTAQMEYRHVKGKFTPSYFSAYYLDERLMRYPYPPRVKSDGLTDVSLDGVYASASANILNLVTAEASYQIMGGKNDELDQRFEARGNIGDEVLKRIPKVNKAEIYFYKTNINRTVVVYTNKGNVYINRKTRKPVYDEFFEQTPSLFWGYRIGVEITKGASLLWDARHGYQWDSSYRLVPYNNISIGAFVSF